MGDEKRTYFSDPGRMFPEIGGDGRVPTEQFLNACQGIADFVGFLGTAFAPVKADISGNVRKVREKFLADPLAMPTIQDLVDHDLANNKSKLPHAVEGLLWLKRGLEFMLELIRLMVTEYQAASSPEEREKSENLSPIIKEAYSKSLQRHHGFVSKQIFKVVILAAPYRRDLLKAVAYGNEGLEEVCVQHMAELLGNFEANVQAVVGYYYEKKLETMP